MLKWWWQALLRRCESVGLSRAMVAGPSSFLKIPLARRKYSPRVFEENEMTLKSGEPLLIWGAALLDDIDDEGKQRTPKMSNKNYVVGGGSIERTRLVDIDLEIPKNVEDETLNKNGLWGAQCISGPMRQMVLNSWQKYKQSCSVFGKNP